MKGCIIIVWVVEHWIPGQGKLVYNIIYLFNCREMYLIQNQFLLKPIKGFIIMIIIYRGMSYRVSFLSRYVLFSFFPRNNTVLFYFPFVKIKFNLLQIKCTATHFVIICVNAFKFIFVLIKIYIYH